MWKARAEAAKEILTALLVEAPLLQRMMGLGVTEAETRDLLDSALDVHRRIEILERDAWTACSAIARQFVREVIDLRETRLRQGYNYYDDEVANVATKFVERFREALR